MASMGNQGSSTANNNLVRSLQGYRYVKSERVANAMLAVDRGLFSRFNPYADSPQSIGYGATISAPHMLFLHTSLRCFGPGDGRAFGQLLKNKNAPSGLLSDDWNISPEHAISLELLSDRLVEGATALDVGSGSGYLTACMSIMVGESGKVIGIEHIEELVKSSVDNIRRIPRLASRLDDGRIRIISGDGRRGYSVWAPYDAIHVGAAAPELPPALIEQLRPGSGRLLVPVGGQRGSQKLLQFDKSADGNVTQKKHMSVSFVPLTSKREQYR